MERENGSFRPIQSWDMTTTPMSKIDADDGRCSEPYMIEPLDEVVGMDSNDLYADMLEHEGLFQIYTPNAAFVPFRRYLVDWMSDVGERFHLLTTTVHCATLYMDKILATREVPRNRWQLIAAACISVASKYEEAEECCPQIPDLIDLTRLNRTSVDFRDRGELEVLRLLGWQLRALPPLHFVNFYMAKGILFVDDRWQNKCIIEKIPKYVKKYVEFFCNLCLQDYNFSKYPSSLLAAAICAASRAALNMEQEWRKELYYVTGYTRSEVNPVFKHLWSKYQEQFPGHGIRTPSPRNVADL